MKGKFRDKFSLLNYLVRGGKVFYTNTSVTYHLNRDTLRVHSINNPNHYWDLEYFLDFYNNYIKIE